MRRSSCRTDHSVVLRSRGPGRGAREPECGAVERVSGRFAVHPPGVRAEGSAVGAFRSIRPGPIHRMRDGAHLALERARNPTRDAMFRFAAVGIASLVAVAGLLAVLGASRVPWVGGSATSDEAESDAVSVPTLAPQPALGLIENDTTKPRSEPDGGPSPISLVLPLVGELLNFSGDGGGTGDISRPRSDPKPFSDPQGNSPPGPNTAPNPSPTATNDPPPQKDDPPAATGPAPAPTSEPPPEPTVDPTTDPVPTTDPPPTPEPPPEPTVDPTTDPVPTTEPPPTPELPPEPTVDPDPGSLTATVLNAIDQTI